MDYTPDNCDKVAMRIVDNMLLNDLKELTIYYLSEEMKKREDLFNMNTKLFICKGMK